MDEYLKEWSLKSHDPDMIVLIVKVVRASLKWLKLISPTPVLAVEFLLYFDKSMDRIWEDKLWLYRLSSAIVDDPRPIDGGILDILGATIKWGRITDLLDRALQSNASLGRRYKAYLLLLLCEFADLSPKHIRTHLEIGVDVNERLYRHSYIGLTKSSPWLGYLGGCYYWTRSTDIDILQLVLDKGANLDDYAIRELKVDVSDGQVFLNIHGLVTSFTFNTNEFTFEMNGGIG